MMRIIGMIVASFLLSSAATSSSKSTTKKHRSAQIKKETQVKKGSLEKSTFEEVLDRYLFIGDFNEKEEVRANSSEVFWRYPFKLQPMYFDLDLSKETMDKMVFQVKGDGRLAEHFAKGRVEFLGGKYSEAHETWLAARQQFFQDALINRRLEFFLALNAAQELLLYMQKNKTDMKDPELRKKVNRVSYFLAAVFILRKDTADPQIDKHAAWGLYNLSVLYYMLERWSLVVGAAQEGLSTLLKQGINTYRPRFHQILAEMWIKNQDLLTAIQEIDTGIRQDRNPSDAVKMFNRAGDIYYGLNNFELADEVYGLAQRIDELGSNFNPVQSVLKAESKFWMGQFPEARYLLESSLSTAITRDKDWLLESGSLPWVQLRIADTYLAELAKAKADKKKKLAEETRLAYFKVESDHPNTEAGRIAQVRGACMDLPSYEGNNVKHARSLLEEVMSKKDIPPAIIELVESCYVGSFSDRERTPEMVQKVKEYATKYPNSKFLAAMLPAVQEVQSKNIDPYFEKGYLFSATEFFEKRREALYKKVEPELAYKLFKAYVDTSRSEKAKEFWPIAKKQSKSDEEIVRNLVFLSEIKSSKEQSKDLEIAIKEAESRKWSSEAFKNGKFYLSRILSSPNSKKNLIWILDLSEEWTKKEADAICTVTYPLIARIVENRKDKQAISLVNKKISDVLPSKWEELQKISNSCAQSWLDLETHAFSLKDLSNKYSKRLDWKLEGAWLERLWTHSEELEKSGRRDEAIKIWQRIAKDAPETSFESKMAKTRLDPNKTEFEGLWK